MPHVTYSLLYIPCKDTDEAKQIGNILLSNRLVACVNVFPHMESLYFWPPGTDTIENSQEAVLLCKTVHNNWDAIEKIVLATHSYENPAILELPLGRVTNRYADWLVSEMNVNQEN